MGGGEGCSFRIMEAFRFMGNPTLKFCLPLHPKIFCHGTPKNFLPPQNFLPLQNIVTPSPKYFSIEPPPKLFVPHPKNLSTIPPLKMFGYPIPQNILPCNLSIFFCHPTSKIFFVYCPLQCCHPSTTAVCSWFSFNIYA